MSTGKGQRQDRLSGAVEGRWNPASLVGSYFHAHGTPAYWQGCVVAEPAPGYFLVELFEWVAGTSSEQRIVSLSIMSGWSFYDSAEWMHSAYDDGLKEEWDRLKAAEG